MGLDDPVYISAVSQYICACPEPVTLPRLESLLADVDVCDYGESSELTSIDLYAAQSRFVAGLC